MTARKSFLFTTAFAALVTGCGGDGGNGVSSTPAPPTAAPPSAPPPPASNTSITELKANQTFANDGGTTNVSFNLASKTTISGRAAPDPLTVRYDVATNSYSVSSAAFGETFSPADRQPDRQTGEALYQHTSAGTKSYLTLATTPYFGNTANKYVGLGYLQRNLITGDRQDTSFTTFAYGLDTPSTGVPRSGKGQFAIDVLGLASFPGSEPSIFQGRGRFDVDFGAGLFSTSTGLTITGLVSGKGIVGGGIELVGGGRLSTSDGSFSGNVVYGSGAPSRLGGTLAGRFFGPNADELGASFAGSASDGSAFNGSFTGQRDTSLPPVNVSFATLVTPQLFFGDATTLTARTYKSGAAPQISDYPGLLGSATSRVQLEDQTSGNLSFGTPTSNLPGGQYTVTSIIAGDVNFTTYQKDISGQPTRLQLYKTGPANRELALTYASFGQYSTSGTTDPIIATETNRVFFAYGFPTPSGLFANRTGTANYAGVAYGAAATPSGTIYDVTGTSQFGVDFSAMRLSGSLALKTSGLATPIDYGSFAFSGPIYAFQSQGVADIAGTGGTGRFLVNFYGPGGEEAAGPFRLRVADGVNAGTLINGVVASKRQ